LKPTSCLFLGLPLKLIQEEQIPLDELLRKLTVPITILQNDKDPVGTYDEVRQFINNLKITNVIILKAKNNTHDYTDFDKIKELLFNM